MFALKCGRTLLAPLLSGMNGFRRAGRVCKPSFGKCCYSTRRTITLYSPYKKANMILCDDLQYITYQRDNFEGNYNGCVRNKGACVKCRVEYPCYEGY
jgi:hypothetical protein